LTFTRHRVTFEPQQTTRHRVQAAKAGKEKRHD
jgi:hypothetical protein